MLKLKSKKKKKKKKKGLIDSTLSWYQIVYLGYIISKDSKLTILQSQPITSSKER